MSSTTTNSSSGLSSAGKKFRNQFDNIFHKYPKLPKELKGDSLPLQIESKISAKSYNIFLDRIEKTGYKFHWDNGNVYIIDMADMEHEAVVA
ncbi:1315_t:CDS:2, partial [Funneliformis caledonium]